jgi:Uncharacterized protein conserved in bacteria
MAALASQAHYFGMLNTLSSQVNSGTGGPNDYRALVCIYFTGGNDGNNTIVPIHDDASVSGYSHYQNARFAQGLALPREQFLPVSVPSIGGMSYGLHPSFGTVTGGINAGLHPLWASGKMAAVTGVGTLIRPIDRSIYQTDPQSRPLNLFSHSDQTNQHENASAGVRMLTGWGGRISDRLTLPSNPAGLVPTINSTAGPRLFTVGDSTQPLSVGPAPTPLNSILALTGYNGTPVANARLAALEAQLEETGSDIVRESNEIHSEALRISRTLNNATEVTVTFPTSDLGNQLKQIARIIKARATLNVTRQIFYCSFGGFDTHAGQLLAQASLLTQFSQATRAFYDEMTVQGLADKVTQFTMTDFNRTFDPAGSGGNAGSDHAWANHQFVIGGAVAGGNFYGKDYSNGTPFPTLVMDGPDDVDFGSNARGRWLPRTSVEQYAATMARWFGLEESDMPYVFPNIANFPDTNLGFMSGA